MKKPYNVILVNFVRRQNCTGIQLKKLANFFNILAEQEILDSSLRGNDSFMKEAA